MSGAIAAAPHSSALPFFVHGGFVIWGFVTWLKVSRTESGPAPVPAMVEVAR